MGVVQLEALLVSVRSRFLLRQNLRFRRGSSSGFERLHLFDEICHNVSVFEIIVSLATVSGLHLVRVVQALERVGGNVHPSVMTITLVL